MTVSCVVLFPTNVIRFTKYCFPSWNRIVTSTIGGPEGLAPAFVVPAGAPAFCGSVPSRGFRSG